MSRFEMVLRIVLYLFVMIVVLPLLAMLVFYVMWEYPITPKDFE